MMIERDEAAENLVLTDTDGNIYALPRRLVERARVPDDLKDVFHAFAWNRPRRPRTLAPIGVPAWRRNFSQGMRASSLPWTVGWFQVPAP